MKDGDIVKLKRPNIKAGYGHGSPLGIRLTSDREVFFRYGDTLRVSARTRYPGNPDSPTPLIHIDLANEIQSQLEIIEQ